MPWSIVSFGRHSERTLPQIIFSDPDWFFWAIEKGFSKIKAHWPPKLKRCMKKRQR